jgi:hypothetical protein
MEFDWEVAIQYIWRAKIGGIPFRLMVGEDDLVYLRLEKDTARWMPWTHKEIVALYMQNYVKVGYAVQFYGTPQNPVIVKIKTMGARHKKYLENKYGMVRSS